MFEVTLARIKSIQQESRIRKALEIVAKESDKRCPVDTGNLRSSRAIRVVRSNWRIVYEAPYAVFVHERLDVHHKNGEAKFLENAWNCKKNEFMDALFGD